MRIKTKITLIRCQLSNGKLSNCQVSNGKVSSVKKTGLTVWQSEGLEEGAKKQADTWFFQNISYYSSVNCQSVKVCQNGVWQWIVSKYAIFEQLSNCQGKVRIKKVKKSSNKWECQSVKRESVKCQKNGFDSLTVGGVRKRSKKASRYVVFKKNSILNQCQLSKCQRVSKWGFDSKL